MPTFNTDILQLARESRGLTQVELSALLGVKQGTISQIENGKLNISEDIVKKLPVVLKYPKHLFYLDKKVIKVEGHYRKKSSLSVKESKEYIGKMTFTEWHINKLSDAIEFPKPNIPSWDIETDGGPDAAARYVREYWNIPRGRINDLGTVIEDNGIVIAPLDLTDMDGLSTYSADYHIPILYINRNRSADRTRYNLAHELAHYICHFGKKIPTQHEERDVEKEANTFASELLLPTKEILPQLHSLTLDKLMDLKCYWKVSMQAILYKAHALKAITDNQHNYLIRQMSKKGYRTKEPIEIPADNITFLKELVNTHIEELGYTKESLADVFGISVEDLNISYFGARPVTKFQMVRQRA